MFTDYKQKYYKYKLKYLNLVGGESKVIDLKKCHPITIAKITMAPLLSQPYSIENYNNIGKKFQEINSNSNNAYENNSNSNNAYENNSNTCVKETVKNISDDEKKNIYRLFQEFCLLLLNLHEYVNIFSLPPFNLSEQVGKIRSLIDNFSFEYTEDNIQDFLNRLTILIPNLCEEIKILFQILSSETYDDITMVNLIDSIFLSLRFQVAPSKNGIFIDIDGILVNVFIQTLTKLDILVNTAFSIYFPSFVKIEEIKSIIFLINEIRRKSENRKLNKKKINNLINKIQKLLIRCGTNKKEDFYKKFKEFIIKLEGTKNVNTDKNEVKDSFLALLDTIKEKIPTTKCVNFYGMDDVSKYDFYDLLKKIGAILVELNNNFKDEIEQKINEVKSFLSTSDRVLSYVKKLKPTEESTEPVEKPENKINRLINELYVFIDYCIPLQSKFFERFNIFKNKIDTSNITQADIAEFDKIWACVSELKDSYKCGKSFSIKEFSKKELYTKLKEIGKLLLSNISELGKEEIQQIENKPKDFIIQSYITQQNQQENSDMNIAQVVV